MDSESDSAVAKLVDFGLSKIVGPNETATEAFGTLGYIAPEVLLKSPYSFSVDLWSFGCTLYASLFGTLPFEDEEETIKKELKFDSPISDTCKDLLTGLLIKDPDQRISLEATLKHPFFESVRE